MGQSGVLVNYETDVDLNNVKISDYGNIVPPTGFPTIDRSYEKVESKTRLTMERGQTTFLVGGSRDYSYYVTKGIVEHTPVADGVSPKEASEMKKDMSEEEKEGEEKNRQKNKVLVININHQWDVDEILTDSVPHQTNYIRKLVEDPSFKETNSKILGFGIRGETYSTKIKNYLKTETRSETIFPSQIKKHYSVDPNPLI